MSVLRSLAVVTVCAIGGWAHAEERLVLYFNENSERVAVALARLRAAIDARVTTPHRARVEHVPVDYGDIEGIRRSLRVADARRPAAIVAATGLIAQLARDEVLVTPVVFGMYEDPVQLRLAASFRRPGARMTGITLYRSDERKRLELLREIAPRARRLGVLVDEWWDRAPDDRNPSAAVLGPIAEQEFGFKVEYFQIDTLAALEGLARNARANAMEAWYVPPMRLGFDHPADVSRVIGALRKPTVYAMSLLAQNGGLMSYQTVFEDPFASWAKIISLILDGFPAGEIPIERPKVFELALNVKAARDQGIAIPRAILLRATHFY